jgi:hypothetical protein
MLDRTSVTLRNLTIPAEETSFDEVDRFLLHQFFDLLDLLGSVFGQDLIAVLGDQDVIFDANTEILFGFE